jgi:phosphoglycerate dehydrogenase-like enzyme
MIGEKELKMRKRSRLLINTARGGLVQEAALIRAFEERWIAGAGFDVLVKEHPSRATRSVNCGFQTSSSRPTLPGHQTAPCGFWPIS